MDHQEVTHVRPWHLEKSISIGHIITTLTVMLGAIWWAAKLETRINILDTQFVGLQARMEVTDRRLETVRLESNAQLLQLKNELQTQLDHMDNKLDTIVQYLYESRNNKPASARPAIQPGRTEE